MDQIKIKVNPQDLFAKSGEFKAEKDSISGLFETIKQKMDSLSMEWEGKASSTYKEKFHKTHDDLQKILEVIDYHVKDLNEAAQIYSEGENKVDSSASSLRTDAIFND